jgi:hypothetical protein
MRNQEVLSALLQKVSSPDLELRRRALAVIDSLEIAQDFQAYVALTVLTDVPASALLCRHLHGYFTSNIRKNPQYKLPEVLQVALLRQQSQYPKVCRPGSPPVAELDRGRDSRWHRGL